jgi:lipopolysaccharide biosynthesis glycosyltransferase
MDTIRLFVGFDPKEPIAFHVFANSVIRKTSMPVAIMPLALSLLRNYEELHTDGSNDFIYSRFLVPALSNYEGWAIYADGDMLLREDLSELWGLRDPDKAVMVVKHNYKTTREIKYLGSKNENYPRKNWSSLILWNCAHARNRSLTFDHVRISSGQYLHRFSWLEDGFIGELPIEWNWLPDEFGINQQAKLLHYTLGTPCFHDFALTPMSDEWHKERMLLNYADNNLHSE